MTAIAWLREIGRPILTDKMERELLHANRRQTEAPLIQHPPCSVASQSALEEDQVNTERIQSGLETARRIIERRSLIC